jgi:methionine sulfoxide reductase heme-binding subunit
VTGSWLWYVSRGTGLVALVLLTLTLLGGILVRGGVAPARLPRFVLWGLHRNVALLTLVFLALHITTVVADAYVPIDLVDAVVPFVSAYRPLWLGLGTVSLDLLLAIVATSLLRARIGHRAWRAVHWLAYALWPTAVLHGFGTGSDVGHLWFLSVTLACIGAVAAALVWRVSLRSRGTGTVGRPAPARVPVGAR